MSLARRRTAATCLLIFVAAFGVFRLAPRAQLYDSQYTLLISHQLLRHGTLDLAPLRDQLHARARPGVLDYHFVERGERVHPFFPLGTALFAAPWTAFAEALQGPLIDGAGRYDRRRERSMQRTLASFLMAAACVVFFLTARTRLPPGWALAVTVSAGLGTQVFSTASRSLWSHTFALLWVALALWLLMRHLARKHPLHAGWIATCLAFAFVCRPTAALSAIGVTGLVAVLRPAGLPKLLGVGAAWACAFAGLAFALTGEGLPGYYAPGRLGGEQLFTALAGHAISPSRGALFYCPLALAVGWLLATRWRSLSDGAPSNSAPSTPAPSTPAPAPPHPISPQRVLAIAGLGVMLAHWLAVSSYAHWWGGHCYGARLMTEWVPWLVVLGTLGLAARRERNAGTAAPVRLGRVERGALIALALLAIAMNGVGAISRGAADWNRVAEESGFEQKLWDWRDPQALHGLR